MPSCSTLIDGEFAPVDDSETYRLHMQTKPFPHPFNRRWHVSTLALVCVYVVLVAGPAPVVAQQAAAVKGNADVNLWALAMEVTQATQPWLAVADRSRSILTPEIAASAEMVPLVSGKRTVARVYPGVEGASQVIAQADATLACQADGTAPCPNPTWIKPVASVRIDPRDGNDLDTLRKDAARTWIFVLPEAWTAVTVPISLTVEITAPHAQPECAICHDGANRLTLSGLRFNPVAPLQLHVVYACVRHNAGDPQSVCTTAALASHQRMFSSESSLVVQTFPVAAQDFRIMLRDPITLSVDGDLRIAGGPMTPSRMNAFHQQICDLAQRNAGRNPRPLNDIYIGFVPGPTLGILGLGGDHCIVVSIDPAALDQSAEVLAEELGHALGRPHAGCNVHPPGEDPPCDPTQQVFPCLHGGICTYGFDCYNLRVINPGNPPLGEHAHDFMSYGGGVQWISPYTYRHLYDALRSILAHE
jgi:hypothetical protein